MPDEKDKKTGLVSGDKTDENIFKKLEENLKTSKALKVSDNPFEKVRKTLTGVNNPAAGTIGLRPTRTSIAGTKGEFIKPITHGVTAEESRARNQSGWDQGANAVGTLIGSTALKVGQSVGYLAGLAGMGNDGEFGKSWIAGAANNGLATLLVDMEEDLKDLLPIYEDEMYKNKTIFDGLAGQSEFWAKDVVDGVAFLLSSIIGTKGIGAIGKATGIGAKGLQATQWTQKALSKGKDIEQIINRGRKAYDRLDILTRSSLMTAAESMHEVKSALDAGASYKGAADAFKMNMIFLAPSNFLETSFLMPKRASGTFRGLFDINDAQDVIKAKKNVFQKYMSSYGGRIAGGFVKGGVSEGLYEENIQHSIQEINKLGVAVDKMSLGDKMSDAIRGMADLSDPERAKAVFLGTLMGAPAAIGSNISEKSQQDKAVQKYLSEVNAYKFGDVFEREPNVQVKVEKLDNGKYQQTSVPVDEEGKPIDQPKVIPISQQKYLDTVREQKLQETGGEYTIQGKIAEDSKGNWKLSESKAKQHAEKIAVMSRLSDLAALEDTKEGKESLLGNLYRMAILAHWADLHFRGGASEIAKKQLKEKFKNVKDPKELAIYGADLKLPETATEEEVQTAVDEALNKSLQDIDRLEESYNAINAGVNRIKGESKEAFQKRKTELLIQSSMMFALGKLDQTTKADLAGQETKLDILSLAPITDAIAGYKQQKSHIQGMLSRGERINIQEWTKLHALERDVNKAKKEYTDNEDLIEKEKNAILDTDPDEFLNLGARFSPTLSTYHRNKLKEKEIEAALEDAEVAFRKMSHPINGMENFNNRDNQAPKTRSKNTIPEITKETTAEDIERYYNLFKNWLRRNREKKNLENDFFTFAVNAALDDNVDPRSVLRGLFTSDGVVGISKQAFRRLLEALHEIRTNSQSLTEISKNPLYQQYVEIRQQFEPKEGKLTEEQDTDAHDQAGATLRAMGLNPQAVDAFDRTYRIFRDNPDRVFSASDEAILESFSRNRGKFISKVTPINEDTLRVEFIGMLRNEVDVALNKFKSNENFMDLEALEDALGTAENIEKLLKELEWDQVKGMKSELDNLQGAINPLKAAIEVVKERIALDENLEANAREQQKEVASGSLGREVGAEERIPADLKAIMANHMDEAELVELSEKKEKSEDFDSEIDKFIISRLTELAQENDELKKELITYFENKLEDRLSNIDFQGIVDAYGGNRIKEYEESYPKNAANVLDSMLSFISDNDTAKSFDQQPESSIRQYKVYNNFITFRNLLEKETRPLYKGYDLKSFLEGLSKNHLYIVGIQDMLQRLSYEKKQTYAETLNSQAVFNKNNLKGGAGSIASVGSEQQIALEKAVDFFSRGEGPTVWHDIAYIKGPGGSGKSEIWAPSVARVLGLDDAEVLTGSVYAPAAENIQDQFGDAFEYNILSQLISKLNSADGTETWKILFFDEVGALSGEELHNLTKALKKYNSKRKTQNAAPLKVIFMGDPNQIVMKGLAQADESPTPAIEDYSYVGYKAIFENTEEEQKDSGEEQIDVSGKENMTVLPSLTRRYRSSVKEVLDFQDVFIRGAKPVEQDIKVKSNSSNHTSQKELFGVNGSSTNWKSEAQAILQSRDFSDGRTRAVIVDPSELVEAKRIFLAINPNIQVVSFLEAQGMTYDEVYFNVPFDEKKYSQGLHNQILYTAASRAKKFVFAGAVPIDHTESEDIGSSSTSIGEQILEKNRDLANHVINADAFIRSEYLKEVPQDSKEEESKEVDNDGEVVGEPANKKDEADPIVKETPEEPPKTGEGSNEGPAAETEIKDMPGEGENTDPNEDLNVPSFTTDPEEAPGNRTPGDKNISHHAVKHVTNNYLPYNTPYRDTDEIPPVQVGDEVYYVRITYEKPGTKENSDTRRVGIRIVAPYTKGNKTYYRQVGILGLDGTESVPPELQQDYVDVQQSLGNVNLKFDFREPRDLKGEASNKVFEGKGDLESIFQRDKNKPADQRVVLWKGSIRDANRLRIKYDHTNEHKYDSLESEYEMRKELVSSTLNDLFKFRNFNIPQADIDYFIDLIADNYSYIDFLTEKQFDNGLADGSIDPKGSPLQLGIPYLFIEKPPTIVPSKLSGSKAQQQATAKRLESLNFPRLYLQLVAKRLTNQDQGVEDILKFISLAEALEKTFNDQELVLGNARFNNLVYQWGRIPGERVKGYENLDADARVAKNKEFALESVGLPGLSKKQTDLIGQIQNLLYSTERRLEDGTIQKGSGSAQTAFDQIARANLVADDVQLRSSQVKDGKTVSTGLSLMPKNGRPGRNVATQTQKEIEERVIRHLDEEVKNKRMTPEQAEQEFIRRARLIRLNRPYTTGVLRQIFEFDKNGESISNFKFGLRQNPRKKALKNKIGHTLYNSTLSGAQPSALNIEVNNYGTGRDSEKQTSEPVRASQAKSNPEKKTRTGRRKGTDNPALSSMKNRMGKAKISNPGGSRVLSKEAVDTVRAFIPNITEDQIRAVTGMEMLRVTKGMRAVGYYLNRTIYLLDSKNNHITDKVIRHEVTHYAIDTALTSKQKKELFDSAREVFGMPNASDLQIEEKIADEFMDWKNNSRKFNPIDKTLWQKIKDIFKQLLASLRFIKNHKSELSAFYNALEDGKLQFNQESSNIGMAKLDLEAVGNNPDVYAMAESELALMMLRYIENKELVDGKIVPLTITDNDGSISNVPRTETEAILTMWYDIPSVRDFLVDEIEEKRGNLSNDILETYSTRLGAYNLLSDPNTFNILVNNYYSNTNIDIENIADAYEKYDQNVEDHLENNEPFVDMVNKNDPMLQGLMQHTYEAERYNPRQSVTQRVRTLFSYIPYVVDTYQDEQGEEKEIVSTIPENVAYAVLLEVFKGNNLNDLTKNPLAKGSRLRQAMEDLAEGNEQDRAIYDRLMDELIDPILNQKENPFYGKAKFDIDQNGFMVFVSDLDPDSDLLVTNEYFTDLVNNNKGDINFLYKTSPYLIDMFNDILDVNLLPTVEGIDISDESLMTHISELYKTYRATQLLAELVNSVGSLQEKRLAVVKANKKKALLPLSVFEANDRGNSTTSATQIGNAVIAAYKKEEGKKWLPQEIRDQFTKRKPSNSAKPVMEFLRFIGVTTSKNNTISRHKRPQSVYSAIKNMIDQIDANVGTKAFLADDPQEEAVDVTIEGIVNLQNIYKGFTETQNVSGNRGRLVTIAGVLSAENNIAASVSYRRGGDGLPVYKFEKSSAGIDNLYNLVNGNLQNIKFREDPVASLNLFLEDPKRLARVLHFDSIINVQTDQVSTYRKEGKNENASRKFAQFIGALTGRGADGFYPQDLWPLGDRPNMKQGRVQGITPKEYSGIIKKFIQQEIELLDKDTINPQLLKNRKNSYLAGLGKVAKTGINKKANTVEETLYKRAKETLDTFIDTIVNDGMYFPGDPASIYEALDDLVDPKLLKDQKDNIAEIMLANQDILNLDESDIEAIKKGDVLNYLPAYNADYRYANKESKSFFVDLYKMAILPAFTAFYVNNYLNGYGLNQLVMSMPQYYKGAQNAIKRIQLFSAQRGRGAVSNYYPGTFLPSNRRVVVIKDIEGKIGREFKEFKRIYGMKGWDITDAQGFFTESFRQKIHRSFGQGAIKDVIKAVQGSIDSNMEPKSLKYSSVLIGDNIKSVAPTLHKVLKDAEEYYKNKGIEVDEFVFETATKNENIPKDKLATLEINDNNEITGFNYTKDSVLDFPNDDWGIQLEAHHEVDGDARNPKQIISMLGLRGEYINEIMETYQNIADLMTLQERLFTKGIKHDKNDALQIKGNKRSERKYRDLLKNKVRNTPGAEFYARFFSSFEKKGDKVKSVKDFNASLNLPFMTDYGIQTWSNLLSNNSVHIRYKGGGFVLQSAVGVPRKEVRFDPDKGVAYVSMPRFLAEEYGITEEDIKNKGPQALDIEMIGFRIPSTDIHSAVILKVASVYDTDSSIVIAPREIGFFHGSDYDVDKLFVIREQLVSDTDPMDGTTSPLQDSQFFKRIGKQGSKKYVLYDEEGNETPITTGEIVRGEKGFLDALKKEEERVFGLLGSNSSSVDQGKIEEYHDLIQKLLVISYKNKIVKDFAKILSGQKTKEKLYTPLNFDRVNSTFKNAPEGEEYSTDRHGTVYQLFHEKGLLEIDNQGDVVEPKLDLNDLEAQSLLKEDISNGIGLTGTAALFLGGLGYLNMAAAVNGELATIPVAKDDNGNSDYSKIPVIDGGVYNSIERVEKRYKDGKEISAEIALPNGYVYVPETWENIDIMINGAIDNLNEQIFSKISINNQTIKAFMAGLAHGIPLNTMSAMFRNPIIRQYYSDGEDVVTAKLKELKAPKMETVGDNVLTEDILEFMGIDSLDELVEGKEGDELKAVIDKQLKLLKLFNKLNSLGDTVLKVSKLTNVTKELPVEYAKIESLLAIEETDLYNIERDTEFSSQRVLPENNPYQLKEDFPYQNANIRDVPHIHKALNILLGLKKTIEGTFDAYSKEVQSFSTLVLEDLGQNNPYFADAFTVLREEFGDEYVLRENIGKQFIHYIMSNAQYTDGNLSIDYVKENREEELQEYKFKTSLGSLEETKVGGFEAFSQRLIKELGELRDEELKIKDPNKRNFFLMSLNIDQEYGLYKMSLPSNRNMSTIEFAKLIKGFSDLDTRTGNSLKDSEYTRLQHNIVKYAALKEGLRMGGGSMVPIFPPKILKGMSRHIDNFFGRIKDKNNKRKKSAEETMAGLMKHRERFAIQLAMRYSKYLSGVRGLTDMTYNAKNEKTKVQSLGDPENTVDVDWSLSYTIPDTFFKKPPKAEDGEKQQEVVPTPDNFLGFKDAMPKIISSSRGHTFIRLDAPTSYLDEKGNENIKLVPYGLENKKIYYQLWSYYRANHNYEIHDKPYNLDNKYSFNKRVFVVPEFKPTKINLEGRPEFIGYKIATSRGANMKYKDPVILLRNGDNAREDLEDGIFIQQEASAESETPNIYIEVKKKTKERNHEYGLSGDEVVTDEATQNLVKNLALDVATRFGLKTSFVNDPDIQWKGYFEGDTVVINLARANPTTVFHEVLHPVVRAVRVNNPQLWNKFVKELKASPEGQALIEQLRKSQNYKFLEDENIYEEAVVRLQGQKAAMLSQGKDAPTKGVWAALRNLWNKIVEYLQDIFGGANYVEIDALSQVGTLDDLSRYVSNTGARSFELPSGIETMFEISEDVNEDIDEESFDAQESIFENYFKDQVEKRDKSFEKAEKLPNVRLSDDDQNYVSLESGKLLERLTKFQKINFSTIPSPEELAERKATRRFDNDPNNPDKATGTVRVEEDNVSRDFTFEQLKEKNLRDFELAAAYGTYTHLKMETILNTDVTIVEAARKKMDEIQKKYPGKISSQRFNWLNKDTVKPILNKLGIRLDHLEKEYRGITDRIHTEIPIGNDDLGTGTTIDLLVTHADGEYSIVDHKTGSRFLRDGFFIENLMKYAYDGHLNLEDSNLGRAKMEIAFRALMVKAKIPEAKFKNLAVVHITKDDGFMIHDMEMGTYLHTIKAYLNKNNKAAHDKFESQGLFDPSNYNSVESDDIVAISERRISPEASLEDRIDYYESKMGMIARRPKASEEEEIRDNRMISDLSKKLASLRSLPGVKALKGEDNDIGVLRGWIGGIYDANNKVARAWQLAYTDKRRLINEEVSQMQKEVDEILKELKEEYVSKRGGVKEGVRKATKGLLAGFNKADVFDFVWEAKPGKEGLYMTDPNKPGLTPAQKKFLLHIQSNMNNKWIEVMQGIAFENDKGKAIPMWKAMKRKNITAELPKDFMPRDWATPAEIADKRKEGLWSQLKIGVEQAFDAKKSKFLDQYVKYNNARTSDYYKNTMGIKVLPLKYMGNPEIIADMDHSLDAERLYKQFMENLISKKHLDPLVSIAHGLKAHLEQKSRVDNKEFKNTIKFIEDQLVGNVFKARKTTNWTSKTITTTGGNVITIDNIIDALRVGTTWSSMILKPVMGTKNAILNIMLATKEGLKGSLGTLSGEDPQAIDFTLKDLARANRAYSGYTKDFAMGNLENNKLYNMAKKLQYLTNNYDWNVTRKDMIFGDSKLLDSSHLYFFHTWGEDYGNYVVMAAQLMHLKNPATGKSLWDSYNDKGDFVGPARGVVKDATGKYQNLEGLRNEEIIKLKRVSQRMFGGYRQEERAAIELYALGRLVMQFKKYMPVLIFNQFNSPHDDATLGYFEAQDYAKKDGETVYEWKDKVNHGQSVVMAKFIRDGLYYMAGRRLERKMYTWNELSVEERQSIRNFLATGIILGGWLAAYFGAVDDEDRDHPMIVLLMRLFGEDLLQGYNPQDWLRTGTNPVAGFTKLYNTVNAVFQFMMSAATGDRLQDGRYKGSLQLMKTFPVFSGRYNLSKYLGVGDAPPDDPLPWSLPEPQRYK
jgi:hypothetical protein